MYNDRSEVQWGCWHLIPFTGTHHTYCLTWQLCLDCFILKTEALQCFERLWNTHLMTQCSGPKDLNLKKWSFYFLNNQPEKNLPNWFAASTTALYPAMLAIELSASNTCARDIRGMQSMPGMIRNNNTVKWRGNTVPWKTINKQTTLTIALIITKNSIFYRPHIEDHIYWTL